MTDATATPAGTAPSRRPTRRREVRLLGRLANWLVSLLIGLAGLLLVTFSFTHISSVDPVIRVVGDKASEATYQAARHQLGLDRPLPEQFVLYVGRILHADLGTSWSTGQPVASDLARAFPATFELATVAIVIGAVLGVGLGLIAGLWPGGWRDSVVRVISLLGYSVPIFWLGLMGLLLFYAKLDWVGGPGRMDVAYEYTLTSVSGLLLLDSARAGQWDAFRNLLSHLVLPASLLGYVSLAYISRMTRSFMLNELSQEYIVAARAKGLSEARIIWRHALRNAMVPLVTVIALSYAGLLEGSVLTETVFAWPGLGLYITNALQNADMNAVLGGTIVVGSVFIGLNLLSDVLYRTLDPRTRQR